VKRADVVRGGIFFLDRSTAKKGAIALCMQGSYIFTKHLASTHTGGR
jgi:hypothetical protein